MSLSIETNSTCHQAIQKCIYSGGWWIVPVASAGSILLSADLREARDIKKLPEDQKPIIVLTRTHTNRLVLVTMWSKAAIPADEMATLIQHDPGDRDVILVEDLPAEVVEWMLIAFKSLPKQALN